MEGELGLRGAQPFPLYLGPASPQAALEKGVPSGWRQPTLRHRAWRVDSGMDSETTPLPPPWSLGQKPWACVQPQITTPEPPPWQCCTQSVWSTCESWGEKCSSSEAPIPCVRKRAKYGQKTSSQAQGKSWEPRTQVVGGTGTDCEPHSPSLAAFSLPLLPFPAMGRLLMYGGDFLEL